MKANKYAWAVVHVWRGLPDKVELFSRRRKRGHSTFKGQLGFPAWDTVKEF